MGSLFRYYLRIAAAVLGLGLALTLVNARADERDAEAPKRGVKGDSGVDVDVRSALGLGAAAPTAEDKSPSLPDDPFPIRRVLLPQDRIAAELERARQGTLVRLQRTDFEQRVRRAADAARGPVDVPRLVDVRYHAKLLGDGFDENSLTGSAEWKIVHSGPGAGLLPLDALQIALKDARWTDGRSALIGALEPRPQAGLALLVEGPGRHSLLLDWSARGVPEPGELRFDLAVPTSPIATFELELPNQFKPVFPQDEVLLAASERIDDKRQLWRVAFGGLAHLEFSLRLVQGDAQSAPVIQASAATRLDLTPGLALCQTTFEFKVLRGDVADLLLEHDPELTVTDVAVLNLESWKSLPGDVNGRKRVSVRLREPARGGQLRISGVAAVPFNANAVWACPGIQILGALPRGETIRLHVGPGLRMLDSRPGTFRLTQQETFSDHSQALTFESSLLPENQQAPTRPTAQFRAAGAEFQISQQTEWEIAADHAALSSRLKVEVLRGALNQFSIRLPPEWEVERVEPAAGDPNPVWTVAPGANRLLQVEMQKPLIQGSEAEFSIHLRHAAAHPAPHARQLIAFPDLLPLGARIRQGSYTVRVSPAFQAFAPVPPEEPDFVGPPAAGEAPAANCWTYRLHGRPPAGPLYLSALTPRFTASSDSTLSVGSNAVSVLTRLTLKPEEGALPSIVFVTSEAVDRPWSWRTVLGNNHVLSVQPIPIWTWLSQFAAPSPLGIAAAISDRPRARWWRMTFAHPLDAPLVLETQYGTPTVDSGSPTVGSGSLTVGSGSLTVGSAKPTPTLQESGHLHVPLVQVVGAARQTGLVVVQKSPGSSWSMQSTGLVREHVRQRGAARQEIYRLGERPVSVVFGPSAPREVRTLLVDGAELITVVDGSGLDRCLYRCRVQCGDDFSLPIGLPAGTIVQEVAVAGRSLSPELCALATRESRAVCTIPIPAGPAWQRIEVLYTAPAPTWTISGRLEPPLPQLPVEPASTRIVWRLAPGVMPLTTSAVMRCPAGPAFDRSVQVGRLVDLVDGRPNDMFERPTGENAGKAAPPAKGADPRTFQQFLLGPASGVEKPVLDTWALAQVNLQPGSLLPAGPGTNWESLGLIIVSVPGAAVVTSPRQLSIWRADAAPSGKMPPTIRAALDDAVRFGRDGAGRFRSVDDWLEPAPTQNNSLLDELGGNEPGWTSWELRNSAADRHLSVICVHDVAAAGWALAVLLSAAGIFTIGARRHLGTYLLLFWLLAAGSALISLPESLAGLAAGPLLAGLLVAVVAVCMRGRTPSQSSAARLTAHGPKSRITIVTAVLLLGASLALPAGAPEPVTVFLLPAARSEREPTAVLAPPELLARLDALSRPNSQLNDSALARARYRGRVDASGNAEFEGEFHLTAFAEQATVVLPLGDVRLREVLLDGAAAFPRQTAPDRIAVDVRGKGEHRIDVKFAAPIAGSGPDRDVRFATPELAICLLEFEAPPAAEMVRAVNWRGSQQLVGENKTLYADLGRAKTVHVRWRQAGGAGNAQVRVQEAALWDISPTSATLYSVLDYRITQGNVSAFKIVLPPNVEVSRLEIRPETVVAGAPPSWARDWSVGPNRVLKIDLQAALTGAVRVLLECVPQRSLTTHPILQAPSAIDVAERDTFLAFRLHQIEAAAEFERKGATEIPAEQFLREVWRNSGAEKAPAPVTRAFHQSKADPISLRPNLQIIPAANRARLELFWQVEPLGAQVHGTARWSAKSPLTYVEWEVPASVTVLDVRGIGLSEWARTGNRVLAFLREPAAEVTLVWDGSLMRSGPPAETFVFEPPQIWLRGAATQTTVLRLRCPEGWVIAPDYALNPGAVLPASTDRELAVEVSRSAPRARFRLRGPQTDGAFRALTAVEVAGRRLQVSAIVDATLRGDRPHSFTVTIHDAGNWQIDLQSPPGWKALPKQSPANDRQWIIEVPLHDGAAPPLRIHMQRSLEMKQEVTLPTVSIEAGELPARVDERLLLIGPELRAAEMIGLRPVADPAAALAPWPREHERRQQRGGAVWQTDGGAVHARVVASPVSLSAAPSIRVVMADTEAAPLGDRWVYRTTFDVIHESGATLQCSLPPGMQLEGIAFEGDVLDEKRRPASGGAATIAIPLPLEGGPRLLQLVWSTAKPRWEIPQLLSAGQTLSPAAALWTANAQAETQIEAAATLSAASLNLRRAAALLELAGEQNVADAQEEIASRLAARASRWLRLADAGLNGPRLQSHSDERGPDGQPLVDWLARLREQADALRIPRPRPELADPPIPLQSATFEKLPYADAFRNGTPTHWIAAGEAPSPAAIHPRKSWTSISEFASLGVLALTVATLGLLILAFGHSTRPEQIAVAGLIGLVAFGWPGGLIFLALTAIGLFVRFVWVGNRALRWLGG